MRPYKSVRYQLVLALTFTLTLAAGAASARTWYVKPDATGDAPTIQAGIDSAAAADTVLLANGTYLGDGNRDINYFGKAITVRSEIGIADSCIINCEGSDTDFHRGFYLNSGELRSSVLDGVTIMNAYAPDGGGVYCHTASPAINNCVFKSNTAVSNGGGLYCTLDSTVVTDCVFLDNDGGAGGGIYTSNSASTTIANCTFSVDSAFTGGGVYAAGRPRITGCKFLENHAVSTASGLMLYLTSSNVYVSSCTFERNSGPGGSGIRVHSTSGIITNCDFIDNSGVAIHSGEPCAATISNCMITGSSTGVYFRMYNGTDLTPSLVNSTIIDNAAFGIECESVIAGACAPTIDGCVVAGNNGGIKCEVSSGGTVTPTIRNCTIVENRNGYATTVGGILAGNLSSPVVENTIIAFSTNGYAVYCENSLIALSCCDVYGNAGGDWVGCIAGQIGVNGNFSEDPQFCGSGNYFLQSDSPCAPGNHPDQFACDLIGTLDVYCEETDVTISNLVAECSPTGVTLRWAVGHTDGIAGFNIYRSTKKNDDFRLINASIVPVDNGNEFVDADARPGKKYWYRIGAVDGEREWFSPAVSVTVPAASVELRQNHPNPFNPSTVISFVVPVKMHVVLSVYDPGGRRVTTLVDAVLDVDTYKYVWDGTDSRGDRVASGVYFCRLEAGRQKFTTKMTLLK
jgi:predicted outer membrane repeat protein